MFFHMFLVIDTLVCMYDILYKENSILNLIIVTLVPFLFNSTFIGFISRMLVKSLIDSITGNFNY